MEYFWKRNHDYYILIHKIAVEQLAGDRMEPILVKRSRKMKKNKVKADSLPDIFLTQVTNDTCVKDSSYNLFSIVAYGSSWMDELVFTVLAENDVWAAEIVRQWLNSNGRENYKIDKVRAIVSRDVRAIVNVGAKLNGSSCTSELVFTVMAENDVWATEIVRQWLNSNGRENYKIDKIRAIISRDVRAIVNVGARLLDA